MASWLAGQLYTERLVLRPTRPGDEEWIIALFTDPEVRRYIGGAMSEQEAREKVVLDGERWGHFAIEDRESREAIGSLSFANKSGFWEISYSLKREFWGKGIMKEAVRAALKWYFSETGTNEVSATTQITNERSCRLLDKLGARLVDTYTYKGALVNKYTLYRT